MTSKKTSYHFGTCFTFYIFKHCQILCFFRGLGSLIVSSRTQLKKQNKTYVCKFNLQNKTYVCKLLTNENHLIALNHSKLNQNVFSELIQYKLVQCKFSTYCQKSFGIYLIFMYMKNSLYSSE